MFRRTFILISLFAICYIPGFASQVDMFLPGITQLSNPLSYGKVYSYEAGTNTLKALYADAALSEPYDNPASLDMSGRIVAYGSGAYKFIIKDRFGNTVFTVDDYQLPFTAEVAAVNPFGPVLTQAEIYSDYINAAEIEVASMTVTGVLVIPDGKIAAQGFDASGNKVEGVADGTEADDAATKGQMDSAISAAISGLSIPTSLNINVYDTPGSALFEVPSGVERIYAIVLGGGGGGGGGGNNGTYLGVGGRQAFGPWVKLSGGEESLSQPLNWLTPISVTPGETLGLTIGEGGLGGPTGGEGESGGAGLDGQLSSITRFFTVLVKSEGGYGGIGAANNAHASSLPEYMLPGGDSPFGVCPRPNSTETIRSGPGAGGVGGGTIENIFASITIDGQPGGDGLIIILY